MAMASAIPCPSKEDIVCERGVSEIHFLKWCIVSFGGADRPPCGSNYNWLDVFVEVEETTQGRQRGIGRQKGDGEIQLMMVPGDLTWKIVYPKLTTHLDRK
ncbi:hypothetical protein QJS10_CPA09g01622 [Acorus calamus]|uniref:Uncharacterized protein n=1 Tax=Acorus calamus TaxID=4465 RepID=A0AAV9E3Q2_ACOCL|nr:hypothetical protein QJS10_CPA09g01622 [Acorus calamus]